MLATAGLLALVQLRAIDGMSQGMLPPLVTGVTLRWRSSGDGGAIFRHACGLGLEGVVSKRIARSDDHRSLNLSMGFAEALGRP